MIFYKNQPIEIGIKSGCVHHACHKTHMLSEFNVIFFNG